MSLITPTHLYENRPTTMVPSAPSEGGSVRRSLFEEAWLQLPRRPVGAIPDATADSTRTPVQGRTDA